MRRLLAGIFLTISLVPLLCRAETTGFVESIGFGWMYRPNCQIAQLPVTQTILNVDAAQGGPFSIARGNKLILAVSDTPAQPVWRDYQQSIGLLEDVIFCPVRSFDLPEDVRGYEMVDGIIWLS